MGAATPGCRAARKLVVIGALATLALDGCRTPPSVGVTVQEDAHPPQAWRALTADEQAAFDLGYSVFNTEWVPANTPAGRIDGLGPLFNSQGCDACHNSRRRGRGPRRDGEAPADMVIQLGRRLPDGGVERGTSEYGYVLNTAAIEGFTPEARVSIRYEEQARTLADGTRIALRAPHYRIESLSGAPLPAGTVLMPRLPPPVQGSGLLELVPVRELERLAAQQRRAGRGVQGRVARLGSAPDAPVGRFGWQSSEPSVADQIGNAFAREMGLTNPLVDHIDCGELDSACRAAPEGGSPEVEPELFNAVVTFERLHAVPVQQMPDMQSAGARLFVQSGCAECHRLSLPVELPGVASRGPGSRGPGSRGPGSRGRAALIHPFTDLLVHDMGEALADRDLAGVAAPQPWRTAPLWGMHAAYASGQPLLLLHDGRARSVEEAVLWHGGEGRAARERFERLAAPQRQALVSWIEQL